MDRRFAARLVGPGLAVSYVGVRRGGCLVAFFACLYFAMLGPSETVALHADDCHLPESCWGPVLVENSATTAGLGFHADCRYSLISPASLARRSTRAAGTGKAMTSGASSGARRPMPSPWWLRPVL